MKVMGGREWAGLVSPGGVWVTGRDTAEVLSSRMGTYGIYTFPTPQQAPASSSLLLVKDTTGPPKFSAFPFKYFS